MSFTKYSTSARFSCSAKIILLYDPCWNKYTNFGSYNRYSNQWQNVI